MSLTIQFTPRHRESQTKNRKNNDEEIWNIVTVYGKYQEVWEIYRHSGLLEAIKSRDEKIEFDHNVSQIHDPKQSLILTANREKELDDRERQLNNREKQLEKRLKNFSENPEKLTYISEKFDKNNRMLDELELAMIKGLIPYFENMADKIRHHHRSHQASEEEAKIIAKYYLNTAEELRKIKTKKDLKKILKLVDNLKERVSIYKHESYKYRWSTSLEKEVIVKLKQIL